MADAPPGFEPTAPAGAPPGFEPTGPAPAPPKAAAQGYDDKLSPLVGGALDTFGLTQRPGARSLKDVALNPQGTSEHVARALGVTGLMALGGAGALGLGLPALAGEAAMSGGIGALEAKAKGDNPVWGGVRDALLTGLTGAAFGRVSAWLNKPGEALSGAIKAPAEVLDAIASRLPKAARFNLPSLSKTPLTATDAVEGLAKLKGTAYKQAWSELKDEISRLDIKDMAMGNSFVKIPGPTAAEQFASGSSATLPKAPGIARRVEAAIAKPPGVPNTTREAVEALTNDPTTQDIGKGLAAETGLPQVLKYARHLLPLGG